MPRCLAEEWHIAWGREHRVNEVFRMSHSQLEVFARDDLAEGFAAIVISNPDKMPNMHCYASM